MGLSEWTGQIDWMRPIYNDNPHFMIYDSQCTSPWVELFQIKTHFKNLKSFYFFVSQSTDCLAVTCFRCKYLSRHISIRKIVPLCVDSQYFKIKLDTAIQIKCMLINIFFLPNEMIKQLKWGVQ